MITKWLRDSGLLVNESKTEVCLFHKNDQPKIIITLQNLHIESKKEMNVLGVIFYCKLNWNAHVSSAICKAKKTLYALRMLRKFFNDQEMRLLLDSNFYSVLYYNSVLWLTPELSSVLKQSLLSISANALRSCMLLSKLPFSYTNQLMKFMSVVLHSTLHSLPTLFAREGN